MTNEILDEVKRIIGNIRADGIEINGTKELNNVESEFHPHQMNLEEEEKEIAMIYNEKIGDWNKRMDLERDHYNFLRAYCIHKIKEIQYFHNLRPDDFTSRKNVVWSQDCIMAIQFISRPHKNLLNIFIRSSDTVNLLVADYLFGCNLLDDILNRFNIKKNERDKVTFFTTSSHWYLKDKEKVDKILGNKKIFDFS